MVLNGGFNPFEPDWTTRESSPNRGDKNNNMKSSRRCNLLALKMCFDNMIPTTRPKTPRYRYQPLTTLDRADCEEKGRNSWQFSEMPEEIFRWRNKREPSKHISENSLTSKKNQQQLCAINNWVRMIHKSSDFMLAWQRLDERQCQGIH